MSAGKWKLKPRDIARAINAVRKAGLPVGAVTISHAGDISVATGSADPTSEPSPLESWKAKKQHARAAEGDQQ
jgi:hypothetical protein